VVAVSALAGLRAVITGGSRGLGRALVRRFVADGARVAFTYARAREESAGDDTLAEVPGARPFRASVLDEGATAKVVAELEASWGGVDILVNNAAISQNLPFALVEADDFDLVMDTNVKGAFLTTRAFLRGMIRRKSGVILNVSSLAGVRMMAAPVHYCASKAALVGFTEALAKDVARHGVRVVCIAPGLLEGGLGHNVPEHHLADYLEHCALGRVGTFDEIAELASFLVSPAASYVHGATIVADGGL
jgi:3-oxoacyl-[acyl-carrier protein] reductase